jgi:hypothetical protein
MSITLENGWNNLDTTISNEDFLSLVQANEKNIIKPNVAISEKYQYGQIVPNCILTGKKAVISSAFSYENAKGETVEGESFAPMLEVLDQDGDAFFVSCDSSKEVAEKLSAKEGTLFAFKVGGYQKKLKDANGEIIRGKDGKAQKEKNRRLTASFFKGDLQVALTEQKAKYAKLALEQA